MGQKEGDLCYYTEVLGQFRFTDEGLKELRPYFAKAGININAIKTKENYLMARQAASPWFMEHMRQLAEEGSKNTLEDQALISIFSGDPQKTEALFAKLEKRNKLGLKLDA
ncbi:MAG: hypothetical protein JAY75_01050 [Candidatus Thiodiazotropha taylori]|nr:hypothetical protein [Candidatus Thiodiazotropha taylori]MCW4297073.1 hypothetical protein [Candidatus Thiodiazotropha endolucinida]MCG8115166.1 hypothetical protein [Candidatus Thiodiazotropha taylori]MCG8121380.1 hypothetical protein [Candidatus Thiodiazotropha taylori]MCW4299459.1 hypothetical protein [Candidatus Thiodiazotropha endolucinida]